MASTIGIKIANGKFYPIMEENSTIKKRLILTTVHDNQPSVQIDLYRSAAGIMSDAQYIGSLVVENIRPRPQGEPSIEMVMSSNSDGEIVADAIDLDRGVNGERYVLTVSLRSLDETSRDMELPDFELDDSEEAPSGLYQHASKIREQEEKKKPNMLIPVLIGLFIILGIAALWLFVFGGLDRICANRNQAAVEGTMPDPVGQPDPAPAIAAPPVTPAPVHVEPVIPPDPAVAAQPDPVTPAPVTPPPEPVQQRVDPVPVIQAPVTPPPRPPQPLAPVRIRPSAPVASYNVPSVIPPGGVDYRIRWGDTLWDISAAFYRDPWQYPRIARHNNISNPNFIISGRMIRIPPRN